MGVSTYRYIQLMRLKRASYQLVYQREKRVTDIAMNAGFESHEAFSRAFKKVFGQTPSQFRRRPAWRAWRDVYQFQSFKRPQSRNVTVRMFPETRVAAYEHLGPLELLHDSVAVFIDWRKESGLSPVGSSKTFGIPYQNPKLVPPEQFRFDICGSVTESVPDNQQGVVNKIIPGGRCAVLRHVGSLDDVGAAVNYLYTVWLPESGEECKRFPVFLHYLNLMSFVDEKNLVTDVYLPLR